MKTVVNKGMGVAVEPASGHARKPLVIVSGLHEGQVDRTVESMFPGQLDGVVVIHHDLSEIEQGVVRKNVRAAGRWRTTALELAHGCVSCTLRQDLLPSLRRAAFDSGVDRIVVRLDPAVEPEVVCAAIAEIIVDETTVDEDVRIDAVVAVVDLESWLSDATSDEELADRGIRARVDDERTVAHQAVGQVEFADAVVLAGTAPDRHGELRTREVLRRLAPSAPIAEPARTDLGSLLAEVPDSARRGEVDGVHGPLLRGNPDLETSAGVGIVLFEHRRPFHPQRLHEALDVLMNGVVRARGRAWLASRPDSVLWLESAGGGLSIGDGGPWFTAMSSHQRAESSAEWQLRASLYWDHHYGDRAQEIVVLTYDADPATIVGALDNALLSDAEIEADQTGTAYPDPFDDWREDPCVDT